jgi:hypothetical protein
LKTIFLPGLGWNSDLPDLNLPSNWVNRCEPLTGTQGEETFFLPHEDIQIEQTYIVHSTFYIYILFGEIYLAGKPAEKGGLLN